MRALKITAALAALAVGLSGCSSAPKRPPEIFTNRNAAIGQLDLGNQAVSRGDYVNAQIFLGEAWRLATSTDDPDTRIRVLLARGNAWFNQGERVKADEVWAAAQSEAESSGIPELVSTAKIYRARGTLAEGLSREEITDAERKSRAGKAKAVVLAEMGNIKDNVLHRAFAWKTIGLAEKELGDAKSSIDSIGKAADLHEKGRYLEDAAYDWYLIASVYSKVANYAEARAALQKALTFDRRAENANGLGMDWMAMGMIEEKAGKTPDAKSAYQRAADIFRSAFLTQSALEAERRIKALE